MSDTPHTPPAGARPRLEIVRAVKRLKGEELVHVEVLAKEAGVTKEALRRWIVSGRGNDYLDGVHVPGKGWHSSREALARFLGDG